MSSIFDIAALPFLAISLVLDNLGFTDLVNFCSLSRKSRGFVHGARGNFTTLSWKFAENKEHSIELDDGFKIKMDPDFVTFYPAVPLEIVTLGGLQVKVYKTETCWYVAESNHPAAFYLDVMDRFTKMILSFCRVKKFELETAWKMDVVDLFVWKYTRSLEYFRFPTNMYSGPDLEFVLQEINVRILELPEDFEEFQYSGPLTMDTLFLNSGTWLTEDNLKTMKCREVVIDRDFSPAQCNWLIRLWLGGHLQNLEKFTVKTWFDDSSEIFRGIATMPWNSKNRPENFKYLDMRRGKDVRRADGTLATCCTVANFDFVVWHPKFLVR